MIIEDYQEYQNKYVKEFGQNTLVLLEVGSFFEYYAIDNENEKWNLDIIYRVKDILDSHLSLKQNSRISHFMGGFPNHSLDKHLNKLLNAGFTVIIIVQESHGESQPTRVVKSIVSPGINIDNNNSYNNNYLCCLNFEHYKIYNKQKHGLSIGIALTDLSTGNTKLYETCSKTNDSEYSMDEIYRILNTYEPKEIIIYNNNYELLSKETIQSKLEIYNILTYFKDYDKSYGNINIQKEILNRSYSIQ